MAEKGYRSEKVKKEQQSQCLPQYARLEAVVTDPVLWDKTLCSINKKMFYMRNISDI